MRWVSKQFHMARSSRLATNVLPDDSDDEKHAAAAAPAAAAQPQYYSDPSYGQSYGQQPQGYPPAVDSAPPAVLPATDAGGDSVSSSDREEVQEAREDYEEALANASEGSSSDQEEIQEAREAYVSGTPDRDLIVVKY